jgi:hypothetical protein
MKERLTPSVSAIIVSAIISIAILVAAGTFDRDKNYATVNFDGGYQKIGYIRSQWFFTHASITNNGSVTQGTFEEITDKLNAEITSPKKEQMSFNAGVRIQAETGLDFEGSDSDFRLTTDKLDLISTTEAPVSVAETLEKMKALREKTKLAAADTVKKSVEFSAPPSNSLSLSKLIARIAK